MLKTGGPQTEQQPPVLGAEAERRQDAKGTLCQLCRWGRHVLRRGRSQRKDVAEKMQFAFALVNLKSPWTCQAASGVRRGHGQGRREPTQTLLYTRQPRQPTQGTR